MPVVHTQANQHLLLQPWLLAKHIGSILISGNILSTTLPSRVTVMHWTRMTLAIVSVREHPPSAPTANVCHVDHPGPGCA